MPARGGAGGSVAEEILGEAAGRFKDLAALVRGQHDAVESGDVGAFVAATEARDALTRHLGGLEERLGESLIPALCRWRPREAGDWRRLLLELTELDGLTQVKGSRLLAGLSEEAQLVRRQRASLKACNHMGSAGGEAHFLDRLR